MGDKCKRLFGTDGVRGRANVHPMTAETALALGQAAAHVFRSRPEGRHRIVIGKDTRLSGYLFEDALAAGISSMGVDVIQVGPMPTPGLAFLTADMRCDAGVMITASHNPFQDNGIKFFGHDGYKLADEIEMRMEALVASQELGAELARSEDVGQAYRIDDATGRYVVFLKNTFPKEESLDGMRIVLDCAHGAAYRVGPTVLSELGANVIARGVEPNGRNINDGVGSLFADRIAGLVRESGADIGIALDGDADRAILVDEKGFVLDGDQVLAVCAQDLVEREKLSGGAVVATVLSNLGLEKAVEGMGLELVRTPVGDRYVVEAMRAGGYNLGGEQSGHIVFREHATTGDGLITALQVLGRMRITGKPLSELRGVFERFPQTMITVAVAEKPPLESLPSVTKLIGEIEKSMAGSGRVLVRYSGTEPAVRVMVEGDDEQRVGAYAEEIAGELARCLGGSVPG
ncbi:MAG: phosphoglucosamine mutase [Myxococcota bacterium]